MANNQQKRNKINKRIRSRNNKPKKKKLRMPDLDMNIDIKIDLPQNRFRIGKILIIVLALLLFSVIFAVLNIMNTSIIKGVTINGINVSGMEREDAKIHFKDILSKKQYEGINITHNKEKYTIELGLLELKEDIDKTVDKAYKVGRSGNILVDNFSIIKTFFFNKNFDITLEYNNDALLSELKWLNSSLPDKYTPLDYYVDGKELILARPISGIEINEPKMIGMVNNYLNDFTINNKDMTLMYETITAEKVDIKNIQKDIFKKPINAHYEEKPFKIVPEQVGIDLDVSIKKAEEIINKDNKKNEYAIPLKITKPKITLANLEIDVFPDILSSTEGMYDVTNYNRANNLALAGNKLDGVIIAPGETFSYNKTLGQRTIAAGFKEAAIYIGGAIADGLGGGICQISSVLYNAALQANLEIVERENHQFLPGYSKPGLDATVYYGYIDFQFKNNRTYPIMISTNVIAGVAEIKILGIKEDTDLMVTTETKIIETEEYETKYVTNYSLDKGKKVLVQGGTNGYTVETYKVTRAGSVEADLELISTDKYDALDQVYEINE